MPISAAVPKIRIFLQSEACFKRAEEIHTQIKCVKSEVAASQSAIPPLKDHKKMQPERSNTIHLVLCGTSW